MCHHEDLYLNQGDTISVHGAAISHVGLLSYETAWRDYTVLEDSHATN